MWCTSGSSRMSAWRDQEGSRRAPVSKPGSRDRIPSPRFPMQEELAAFEPTLTPSTHPPLIRAAIAVGTGAAMQPSASRRPSCSTGLTKPGKAQLARMATSSGPVAKTYGRAGVEIGGYDRGWECAALPLRSARNHSCTNWPMQSFLPSCRLRLMKAEEVANANAPSQDRKGRAGKFHPRRLRQVSAPILVPTMAETGMRSCSRTSRTPRWAKPREKPPPRPARSLLRRNQPELPRALQLRGRLTIESLARDHGSALM